MNKLRSISSVLESFCRLAAGTLMLFMMIFVFAEIAGRFIFGVSHEFVPAISAWAMVWMTFFIFGVALKTREHISVDILPVSLPARFQTPLLTFYDLISLAFSILLCIGSIKYVLMVRDADVYTVTVQFIPMWIIRLCVPMGGFFLALFSCEQLINDLRLLMGRSKENEP